ncbi:MAG: hypothetical protein LAP40_01420 [Acidobacteriia bacterium]|nr:hypothetical protein [Terriglobia bacterium]
MIAAAGVLRIEFLLVPPNPLVDCGVSVGFSLVVILWCRRSVSRNVARLCSFIFRLAIPSLCFIFFYALIFGSSGFELLSTGSDEVMYGMEQEELIHNTHRDTPDDNPIMRLNHYVQDYPAKEIAYYREWRRGPDMLSVATAMLLGMAPQQVYPVTFACLTLTLAASVLFLCRQAFHLKMSRAWPLPLFFLVSVTLWTMHLQGNFNNLSSWPLFLLAPFFLDQALVRARLRWLMPLALIVASVYNFYYEPALVSLVAMLAMVFAYRIVTRRTTMLRVGVVFAVVVPAVLILNPTIPVKLRVSSRVALGSASTPPVAQPPASLLTDVVGGIRVVGGSDWWPHITGVLFGMNASVDVSEGNQGIRYILLSHRHACLLAIYGIIAVSGFGLLFGRRMIGFFYCVLMLAWFAAAHLFVLEHNFFMFYRSSMYAMPFLTLGLGLAFLHAKDALRRRTIWWRTAGVAALGTSAAFLFMNSLTSAALGAYVFSHSVCDDHWIRRTNPKAKVWTVLRETLSESRSPVMISGFTEPPRVLWLASGIKPLAHFMGKSTSDHWIFGVHANPDRPYWILEPRSALRLDRFYTRRTEAELVRIIEKENIPWSQAYAGFLEQSRVAIVPVQYGFPQEWGSVADIYGPAVLEFPNIGDVVYRNRTNVTVAGPGLGPLITDEAGKYRELTAAAAFAVDVGHGQAEIVVLHDGAPGSVDVVGDGIKGVQHSTEGNESRSVYYLRDGLDSFQAKIEGKSGTRIREISARVVLRDQGCLAEAGTE